MSTDARTAAAALQLALTAYAKESASIRHILWDASFDDFGFEITVAPKGLAELQAGLIAEVRGHLVRTTPANDMAEIVMAFRRYDSALASLGTGKGATNG